jgi:hypothetical protein
VGYGIESVSHPKTVGGPALEAADSGDREIWKVGTLEGWF